MRLSEGKTLLALGGISFAWLFTTSVFWVGYGGTDDLFYARYAYLFHRPPTNWWEFRLPAILAIRASFRAFGPSELAAALPTLLSSLLILGCVAWQVDWLKRPTWEGTLAVILACTLPLDVGFRSVPSAGFVAAGLVICGSVCILRGKRHLQLLGSLLLAAGFVTHEVFFFYIAIFGVTLLVSDWRRFWKAVSASVAMSGALLGIEAAAYYLMLGDFLARFRTAAGTTANLQVGVDPDTGISGMAFFLWPLQNLVLSKPFGADVLLLLAAGLVAWRRLEPEQRILLCSSLGLYFWLGYGTQVPWSYKPFYRQFHYYFPMTLGVASVLPFAVRHAVGNRAWVGRGIVVLAVSVQVLCLAAGGRWGQNVDVSRQLLHYANQHSSQRFMTDVQTMNHMYVVRGFQLPPNVVCINGPAVEKHLLLNKEPPGTPRSAFPEGGIDAILLNLEGAHETPPEDEFMKFLNTHHGDRSQVAPVRYRLLFLPVVRFLEPKPFMVRSLGGAVVYLPR